MKNKNLGLSIVMGGIFSTFITSIYILMSTVPALIGQAPEPTNPLGQAIVVWFVLTFFFSYLMNEWQGFLDERNEQGRIDREEREKREREQNGTTDPKDKK